MFHSTKALVLREVRYKETDKILTLLTADDGKLTVKARGALRKGSKIAAATQQLTYSEMTLFFNRGKYTVNEAALVEDFSGLRADFSSLALACYFAECLEAMSVEDQPEPQMLQLGLNSLYALSRNLYPAEQIKAAFELRLMAIAGYRPEVAACTVCDQREPENPVLCLDQGVIMCRSCAATFGGGKSELCAASLAALRYIQDAPAKQLFSFQVEQTAMRNLSVAAEQYLLRQTERRFSTLEYWKSVR